MLWSLLAASLLRVRGGGHGAMMRPGRPISPTLEPRPIWLPAQPPPGDHHRGAAQYSRLEGGSLYLFHAPARDQPTEVDVVFVHGLWQEGVPGTPWRDTWRSDEVDGDGKPRVTRDGEPVQHSRAWPDELLGKDLPTARIMSFSYNVTELRANGWDLRPIASSLIHDLREAGVGTERPVVFVGHSLGGLVIKTACQQLSDEARGWRQWGSDARDRKEAAERFLRHIRGFAFYATPHKIQRLGKWLEIMNGGRATPPGKVRFMENALRKLHNRFKRQCRDYHWDKFAFCETFSTAYAGEAMFIKWVPEESAADGMDTTYMIAADHRGVCRPPNAGAPQYTPLRDHLAHWLQETTPFAFFRSAVDERPVAEPRAARKVTRKAKARGSCFHWLFRWLRKAEKVAEAHYKALVEEYLYVFYEPPAGKRVDLDIVFVHGLDLLGDASRSWRDTWTPDAVQGGKKRPRAWPDELLSQDLPNARMLSFSYDSSARRTVDQGRTDLEELGPTLVDYLRGEGVGTERPVVFVAHSLGGLVVKQACTELSHKAYKQDEKAMEFVRNIRGVVFYATPHRGSELANWGFRLLCGRVLHSLMKGDPQSSCLHGSFMAHCESRGWKTLAFIEKKATRIKRYIPFGVMVVKEDSAKGDIEQSCYIRGEDHLGVCKPDSRADPNYKPLVDAVRGWVKEAGWQKWW